MERSNDLRSQLAPIANQLKEGRSEVRPICQLTLRLHPTPKGKRFDATVDAVLRWMNRRAGRPLPETAWKHVSFELTEIGAQRAAAVSLPDDRYWAARLDDADKTVPQRTWTTEV